MKKIISTVILSAVIISCNNKGGGSTTAVDKLQNEDQKAGYAYGMNIGDQVKQYSKQLGKDSLNYKELQKGIMDFLSMDAKARDSYATGQNIGMSIANFLKTNELEGVIDQKFVVQGLMDALDSKKTPLFAKDSINAFMTSYMQKLGEKIKAKNQEEGTKFLAKTKENKNVKSTESGLLYEVITEGTGETPTDASIVEVNYIGKTIDGETFDESEKGKPVKFSLNGVIKGWQEGLKLMKAGSKYKFYIPSELAYGEMGSPDGQIKPNSALVFEVELVSVQAPQSAAAQMPQTPVIPQPK